jgi:hypothetical protein
MNDIEITKLVAETFQEYFGKERICGKYRKEDRSIEVILYTPNLTITNEHGNSHLITDLYTLIEFKIVDGACEPWLVFKELSMKRGSVSQKEYKKNYIHSHARFNSWSSWAKCCLGTGPLNRIQGTTLSIDEMNVLNICALVEQYQRVESVEGVPYNYLNKLNESATTTYRTELNFEDWNGGETIAKRYINNDFLKYLLKKKIFDFYLHDCKYFIKGAFDELILIISYQWYLYSIEQGMPVDVFENTTIQCEYKDYKFLKQQSSWQNNNEDRDIELGIPVKVLTFKNEPVFLQLEKDNKSVDNTIRLVRLYKFAPNILYAVQTLVNLLSHDTIDNESIDNRTREGWDIKIA